MVDGRVYYRWHADLVHLADLALAMGECHDTGIGGRGRRGKTSFKVEGEWKMRALISCWPSLNSSF